MTEVVAPQESESETETQVVWFLSGQVSNSEAVRHFPIHSTPYQIGRRRDLALCINHPTISGCHAEFIEHGNMLVIRDLQSTNGTYVNGKRLLDSTTVQEDDLVQFADVPFRIRKQNSRIGKCTVPHEDMCDMAMGLVQFDRLMSERAVTPFYQPIVSLTEANTIGYEVLGRSHVMGLETPAAMFQAASQLDLEVELSRMFRWEGINNSVMLPQPFNLFVNTHPLELEDPGLTESMKAVRDINPSGQITLEIHEAAITNCQAMRELKDQLRHYNINLAYDDFGAGQTRLVELVEVRPDFLKFDMSFIRDINAAPQQRQQMLSTLVRMVRELGVIPIAEGVETAAEGETCQQIGFELGQGFFFGRPAAAKSLLGVA